MNHCHLLHIEFEYDGHKQSITPVLLQDEQDLILVDCGYPNFIPLLEKAALQNGIAFDLLTKVIVTHHDMDHIGSLAELKRKYPQIEVIAHEREVPYIEGTKNRCGLNRRNRPTMRCRMKQSRKLNSLFSSLLLLKPFQ